MGSLLSTEGMTRSQQDFCSRCATARPIGRGKLQTCLIRSRVDGRDPATVPNSFIIVLKGNGLFGADTSSWGGLLDAE